MDANVYLSGLYKKHFTPFISNLPVNNTVTDSEQIFGFKLMESSFHTPPRKPKYLTKVKVVKKKSVAF